MKRTAPYVEEFEPIMTIHKHAKKRVVEVFLGEATGNYVVNLTENGEWCNAVFVSQDKESAVLAAFHISMNGLDAPNS